MDFVGGELCCSSCTVHLDSLLALPAGTTRCPTCGGDLVDAAATWERIQEVMRAFGSVASLGVGGEIPAIPLVLSGKVEPSERRVLVSAILRARRCGLPTEFRDGYRRYRAAGDSVAEACWCSLYDWDMLDVEQIVGSS